jgi:heme/copper-type cytochrome/quinol oxidase subunit 2
MEDLTQCVLFYIILLIIYLFIGIITFRIAEKYYEGDPSESGFLLIVGVFWPITIIVWLIVILIIKPIYWLTTKIIK